MSKLQDKLNAIRQSQAKAAPSLRPQDYKKAPEPEEIVPLVEDVIRDTETARRMMELAADHRSLSLKLQTAKQMRDKVTDTLKQICATYRIQKVLAGAVPVTYYPIRRSTVDPMQLVAAGVSKEIIEACTVRTVSWALRTGATTGGSDEAE